MTAPDPPLRPRPLRAALLGLALGCAIGGALLCVAGARTALLARGCADLDCDLEQTLGRERARNQLGFGGALCLLGVGLLWLPREPPSDGD